MENLRPRWEQRRKRPEDAESGLWDVDVGKWVHEMVALCDFAKSFLLS